MNFIPAPLEIASQLRLELQLGRSVSAGLLSIVENKSDRYYRSLKSWLLRSEAGQDRSKITDSLPELVMTPARRHLLSVLEKGIRGASIDSVLGDLETEFFHLAEVSFERKTQILPLKLLAPLTLFILPGVVIIMIAPLFSTLTKGF